MLANYISTAVRNVRGHWLYSAINIAGLGIGLTCCLLILLFVRHELSYESQFANAERIYRISREYFPFEGARARIPAQNNWPVGNVLPEAFPGIERVGRIFGGNYLLRRGETAFDEPGVRLADSTIPAIFNFEWLAGDPATALAEPNAIVMTETLARKYFGDEDALGQTLEGANQWSLRVTGVIRDLANNTHLDLSGMISMSTFMQGPVASYFASPPVWNSSTDFHTYVLLKEGASVADIENGIPAFLDRYAGENASQFSTMKLMNLRDIHLRSDRDEEWKPHGSLGTVYNFAGIAFSVLLIACINFISISTARSSQRVREVGVRRAIGASRGELVTQFLGESCLTTLVAIGLALILLELALPAFSAFTGIEFTMAAFAEPGLLIILAGLTLFTAVAAGSYPAFFLANLGSGRMLRGHMTRDAAGLRFRNGLVVFQFAIAIALVVATSVIYLQREYESSMDLGFDREGIVVLQTPAPEGYEADWASLKQSLLNDPAIESVTTSHFLPFGFNDNQAPVFMEGMTNPVRIQYMLIEDDFFETYGISTLSGRVFSPQFTSDTFAFRTEESPQATTPFVLNAAAARLFGLQPDTAPGTTLHFPLNLPNVRAELTGPIIGVVNDTHFESARNEVRPLIFIRAPAAEVSRLFQGYRQAAIRVNTSALPAALAHIDATAKSLFPGQNFERHFLLEDFDALHEAEERQGTLLFAFAALAILIACFGLFGLASFNAERRTKEIGVRKVMGGSVFSIVLLLTNDVSRLVLLANIIAWPLAYVAMSNWLEGFAYRIDLTPLMFIGSSLIALCIAWVTVGGTAAKAASAKPVVALRYE